MRSTYQKATEDLLNKVSKCYKLQRTLCKFAATSHELPPDPAELQFLLIVFGLAETALFPGSAAHPKLFLLHSNSLQKNV